MLSAVLFFLSGDGRQGKWEATGHIVKLQEASEEVTMELRDSSKLPIDTTTGDTSALVGFQLGAVDHCYCIAR